jgi:hypothetical protein
MGIAANTILPWHFDLERSALGPGCVKTPTPKTKRARERPRTSFKERKLPIKTPEEERPDESPNGPLASANPDGTKKSDTKQADTKQSWYAHYVLFVLVLVYIFNFIDRNILSILAEEIKADLGIDDSQMGFFYGTVELNVHSLAHHYGQ